MSSLELLQTQVRSLESELLDKNANIADARLRVMELESDLESAEALHRAEAEQLQVRGGDGGMHFTKKLGIYHIPFPIPFHLPLAGLMEWGAVVRAKQRRLGYDVWDVRSSNTRNRLPTG